MTERLVLRDVTDNDVLVFFDQQRDPEASAMAAFGAKDPTDRDGFLAHWAKIRGDETVTIKAIEVGGQVVGNVVCFTHDGKREVGYWFGRPYWGRGFATAALAAFLEQIEERPLYACAAEDNVGSIRVLEKCGFAVRGRGREFSHARGEEVDQVYFELR